MALIPPNIVDDILQTARIEEVIGEFVQLKRAGSNLKGLSPFTEEKTPSFMVSPSKQIFKCFSTGKGGNVASFLMEIEHFSYPEALRWLAKKYNIEVPEEREQTPEEIAQINERESLYIINDFAKNHFVNSMFETAEGKSIGLSYFVERGFREDTIRKFQLGYCLDSGSDFTEAAHKKGYKQEYLEKVGLVKTKDNRSFDFFRGRVMFPILSISGRVLGFGGRTLRADKNIAKYFNSPESEVYNKSKILYGLFFAKNSIVKLDNCFLVEGYTDVVSLHQTGIENVVASSGTSLTIEQIKLIKRYTNNITILYDGDAAGIKASFRGIDLILEQGMNVKVVLFPDGDDPDSYAKKVGPSELNHYIETHVQDFITFKAGILLEDGKKDPLKRAELIKTILQSIALIPDVITRSVYIKSCADLFEMEESTLVSEVNRIRRGMKSPDMQSDLSLLKEDRKTPSTQHTETEKSENQQASNYKAEENLVRVLLKYGTLVVHVEHSEEAESEMEVSVIELIVHEIERDELSFTHPVYARIYAHFKEGIAHATLYKMEHFLKLQDADVTAFVSQIELSPYALSPNWLGKHRIETKGEEEKLYRSVMESIYVFKLAQLDRRFAEIREQLKSCRENAEQIDGLLQEQMSLEYVKRIFNEKLGRIVVR